MPNRDNIVMFRLIVTGMVTVAGSIAASLLLTHASFIAAGQFNYRNAMLGALLIPLCASLPAYSYIARLNWQLHKANSQLDALARQDTLTGVCNRRAFTELATMHLANGGGHVLAMADIDHFKQINDNLGHAMGDLALQHTARLLRDGSPEGSLIARIGGEEFALLIPLGHTLPSIQQAEALIESMRLCIASGPVAIQNGAPVHMTASFGLASAATGETLDSLLSRADGALYAAKSAGRNRVVIYTAPHAIPFMPRPADPPWPG